MRDGYQKNGTKTRFKKRRRRPWRVERVPGCLVVRVPGSATAVVRRISALCVESPRKSQAGKPPCTRRSPGSSRSLGRKRRSTRTRKHLRILCHLRRAGAVRAGAGGGTWCFPPRWSCHPRDLHRLRVVKARRRRQQREAPPRPWKSSVTNSTACARLKAKTSSKPWPKRQTQTRAHVVDPTAGMAEDTASEIPVKGIKMDEVEKHSSIDDLWLVIDGTCACRDTTDAPGTLCASRLRRFLVFNFARGAIDTAASTPTHPD